MLPVNAPFSLSVLRKYAIALAVIHVQWLMPRPQDLDISQFERSLKDLAVSSPDRIRAAFRQQEQEFWVNFPISAG
ncbi:hypothetical protein METH_23605 (plasmid) [Leisingera methylohalidivorans DSM 14336]|uniref:Uncharacterized protein n=1 Tax=Leisingera methylohalidivorans DSM 14336 TaxID=999552 RepID=V9W144_9RHOB|nr:hypothetical protein METH_23605 [Leisingera methylohalidivorans DSM 14336]